MNFTQEIWPFPNGEPVIVGKFHHDAVLVAIVDDVQVRRLVVEIQILDGQLVSVLDIDGGLHLACGAQLWPMAWTHGAFFIRIGRRALFLTQHQVQMMVFALTVFVLVLTGLSLLGRLRHLR